MFALAVLLIVFVVPSPCLPTSDVCVFCPLYTRTWGESFFLFTEVDGAFLADSLVAQVWCCGTCQIGQRWPFNTSPRSWQKE